MCNDLVLTFSGLNPTLVTVILTDSYRALLLLLFLLLLLTGPFSLTDWRRRQNNLFFSLPIKKKIRILERDNRYRKSNVGEQGEVGACRRVGGMIMSAFYIPFLSHVLIYFNYFQPQFSFGVYH